VLVLCIGVALLRSICFTAPWTPVQRSKHVKRAATKGVMSRLKGRVKSILGRDLEPEDLVLKHQVSLELPCLKDVESVKSVEVVGTGDDAGSAQRQAVEIMLNSLAELSNSSKANQVAKSSKSSKAKANRTKLSIGQQVKIEYVKSSEDGKSFKVRMLEIDDGRNRIGILPQDDFAAAFPDRDPEAGDTFEAKIYQIRKGQSPIVTVQDGDFTRNLPEPSEETMDLFMGLGEQMLDAEVVRRTRNGLVATVKSPDGEVATGFLPLKLMDDGMRQSSYPGKAFQVRVQQGIDDDKVRKMTLIPLTMK